MTRSNRHLSRKSAALFFTFLSALGIAQERRLPRQARNNAAAIIGQIRNASGLGIAGSEIEARSGTHVVRMITGGDGVFRFTDLPPGNYLLTIQADGYAPVVRSGVAAYPGQVQVVEIAMKATPGPPAAERMVPRQPALGKAPAPAVREPITVAPYPSPVRREQEPVETVAVPGESLPPPETIFTPVPNRWEYDYPPYHRYHQPGEYPYVRGHWYDPFNRNKLKGDYPIFGNRTFLNITLTSNTFAEGRRLPTPSNVGSENPDSANFFGGFGQFVAAENLSFSFDLFHGDAAFRPVDWRIRFTPEVNVNYLLVQERGIVNIDVRKGTTRLDSHGSLQEAFVEAKLKDLSSQYDFVSARAGIQGFNSDFRGFIFSDQEPGLRIFGNLRSNRYQYNVAAFAMLEKDTNSGLNRFEYRHQQVYIANLYRQDFVKPGYTIQVSFHYDKDDPSFRFDENHFLVRPAPVGALRPHAVRSYYYGLTGDGHLGRLNLTHAFYQVLGHDTLNPIAGRKVDINAQMAAAELSLDKNWLRYRVSFFYASGDKNPRDGTARGFDAIFDSPNFAGGIFSFWSREGIRLTGSGVALTAPDSLIPSLRSSKIEGQANYVNPGLFLYNAGVDADVTPKLRAFANFNLVRFARTEPLKLVLFQENIHAGVGADSGLGIVYRPPLSENMTITAGMNVFAPFRGFRDIYTNQTLLSGFVSLRLRF